MHRQGLDTPVTLQSCQHSVIKILHFASPIHVKFVVIIRISMIANDIEHFVIPLLAIPISFVNFLFTFLLIPSPAQII